MTKETRTLIEVADITGVELQCGRCGACVLYPFARQIDRLVDKCPNCFDPWFPNKSTASSPKTDTDEILRAFAALREMAERKHVGAKIRFHVAISEEKDKPAS